MSELIDDLLGLARVSRSDLVRRRLDVGALARSVVSALAERTPGHAVEVAIEEGLTAEADPRLTTVLLENLIGNAWKFTGKTPRPRIEIGRRPGSPCVFYVRDNGAGFDMAYAANLFAPFQRLHRDDEFEGSGIGLATVQRVVGRHRGQVWAEAEVGKGATFYFTLAPEA
jgi:light-regulated signal transduction histidine kinase (bacteriophytochrome)